MTPPEATDAMRAYEERFQALRAAVKEEVDGFECKTPAYGAPGHAHCAACCYGTLLSVTSREEEAYAMALANLLTAMDAYEKAGQG